MKLPLKPPAIADLIDRFHANEGSSEKFYQIVNQGYDAEQNGIYRHWDVLRHLEPPAGYTVEEWWLGIKVARRSMMKNLPLVDVRGEPFKYAVPESMQQMISTIDRQATGSIHGSDLATSERVRETYIIKSLMEEAITSSQLEGASTTREVAKDMIRRQREPRDKSERMIMNNYNAMMFIREVKSEKLTPAMIFELHRILTHGTLDDESAAGRLRRDDEPVQVMDDSGNVIHTPPQSIELEARLNAMCEFANDDGRNTGYIHPVVRAIMLHFWLGYDHPFVDGNGRTARALFYWLMSHSEFWLCEFISISSILKRAPAQYAKSFLYTETDDNDATYFILNQMRVILRAIDALHAYLSIKQREMQETKTLIQRSNQLKGVLNHRQLALLNHALRNPNAEYSIISHETSHNVSYLTARKDLLLLRDLRILDAFKRGPQWFFFPPPDLRARLELAPSEFRRRQRTVKRGRQKE